MSAGSREIVSSLHTGLFNFTVKTQRSAQYDSDQLRLVSRLSARLAADLITIGVDGHGILRVLNDQPGGKGAWPFNVPFRMISTSPSAVTGAAPWVSTTT
jgi:hypothetical protein